MPTAGDYGRWALFLLGISLTTTYYDHKDKCRHLKRFIEGVEDQYNERALFPLFDDYLN